MLNVPIVCSNPKRACSASWFKSLLGTASKVLTQNVWVWDIWLMISVEASETGKRRKLLYLMGLKRNLWAWTGSFGAPVTWDEIGKYFCGIAMGLTWPNCVCGKSLQPAYLPNLQEELWCRNYLFICLLPATFFRGYKRCVLLIYASGIALQSEKSLLLFLNIK